MITVALQHKTTYQYGRLVTLGPQVVRLRPAPQCRTPIASYSLNVAPEEHFVNWQQDAHGNYLARFVFPSPTTTLEFSVDLVAEMTVINPFDFFLEETSEVFPFRYGEVQSKELRPYLEITEDGPEIQSFLEQVDRRRRRTIDFLVELNQLVEKAIEYVVRLEPGVQSSSETLSLRYGSCRDSGWLMVQLLRHLGLAARFVSGYLIQLKPDVKSLDGPVGAGEDFTDLHAWAEVFLPGAGWVGLDPTSGLLAGEGHIPLACTPEPLTAAPISGMVEPCEVDFSYSMSVGRVREDPRVTKPYTDKEWSSILNVGDHVEDLLHVSDVRLTVGGEPTFVSVDDMEADEWNTAALGPTKRKLAGELIQRLRRRFAPGGLVHYGTGKWYPGEALPRWALTCLWRADGQPVWVNPELLAMGGEDQQHTVEDSKRFSTRLAKLLRVDPRHIDVAYEDALYCLWRERRLAVNRDLRRHYLDDPAERGMAARLLERGVNEPTGCLLPLVRQWWNGKPRWVSGYWPVRSENLYLTPGDSPMGLRLPLDSLPNGSIASTEPVTPFEAAQPLPGYEAIREQYAFIGEDLVTVAAGNGQQIKRQGRRNGARDESWREAKERPVVDRDDLATTYDVIRTAMCFEPRDGILHVFMPPTQAMEDYLDLLAAVEQTAAELEMKVVVEGYLPPHDHRLNRLGVTPDPGVIEVNVHPAANWREAVSITHGVYEDARASRLGTEKFDQDGTHTGTGGGNHVVMGGRTPSDSPFLRKPSLLRSLVAYWLNHPSLSYLFSGKFIGATSQAPRVDEGRSDAIYELEIAFEQLPEHDSVPPWLVDRVFRHLLVDVTGNTHRAEFCIDKLYSPDSLSGRLGLVELRAFEMPPHWQMSMTQQLLLRALIARFWKNPLKSKLIEWSTSLHDRWMLPHFVRADLREVVEDLNAHDIPLELSWFDPHFEFRFPLVGEVTCNEMDIELRCAIEPWYVLGEENASGGQARFVDSSVERLQFRVSEVFGDRYAFLCNGRRLPLKQTSRKGEYVAGIRYRAWQPPSCLHPTIPVDSPLVFDVVDTYAARSIGGCSYYVGHPGGLNPTTYPLNAYEAESRRNSRFTDNYNGGVMEVPPEEHNPTMPMTLDLRKGRMGTVWT